MLKMNYTFRWSIGGGVEVGGSSEMGWDGSSGMGWDGSSGMGWDGR